MAPKVKTPEPVEPPPPIGPVQEVHVVLKVRLRLKPPAPEPPPQEAAPPPPPPADVPPSKPPTPPGKGGKGAAKKEKPLTPSQAKKAAAAAAAAAAAEAAAAALAAALAKPVDPASLVLTVKYTPFAGSEQAVGPLKPVKYDAAGATPADALAAAVGAPAVPPLPDVPPAAAGPSPVPPSSGSIPPNPPYASVEVEHHARVLIDEAAVRSLAAAHGMLALSLTMATPAPEVDPSAPPPKKPPLQASKSKASLHVEQPPPTPQRSYGAVLMMDVSGLLVGDTGGRAVWPDKAKGVPRGFEELAESIEAEMQLLSLPPKVEKPPTPPPTKGRKSVAAKKGADKKGEEAPPPEPELKDLPGEPIGLMPRELIPVLNPIVIHFTKAKCLPAAPATRALLDAHCVPPALFLRWPPGAAPREQPGLASPWQLPDTPGLGTGTGSSLPSPSPSPRSGGGSGVLAGPAGAAISRVPPSAGSRYILFGQPEVFLAGDLPGAGEGALALCREAPLLVEVHDRTAIPEPPEFPLEPLPPPPGASADGEEGGEGGGSGGGAGVGAAAGAPSAQPPQQPLGSEGYVCGLARISLLDLARGYTYFRFHAPLAPHTTVRGAASLDWTKRPGNYAEAGSLLKGEVRCAAPLATTRGADPALRVFARALFIMDYRDSDLFHMLEDTLRKNNAWKLGLKQPSDKLAPEQLPPELLARRRALEAARAGGNGGPSGGPGVNGGGGPNGGSHRHSSGSGGGGMDTDDDAESREERRRRRSSISSGGSLAPALQAGQGVLRRSSSMVSLPDMGPAAAAAGKPGAGRGGVASPGLGPPPLPRRDSASPANWANATAGLGGNDSKRHVLFDSDSEDADEPDEPPTAAERALDELCADIDRVRLEMRELQALSTAQLSPEQASDRRLDLLTGWHLVDGRERVIVVEGLAEGAMKIVRGIADWALEKPKPEEGWRRRSVLLNAAPALRSSSRLYAPLGADLWILKLRAPLPRLLGEPGSFATGRVRPDCVQGLRRLGALRSVAAWSRQAADLALWPSPAQLQLVDKKFGGELLAADVLGVEVDEPDSDDEDGGPAMGGLLEDARSSRSGRSRRSSRSRRSARSGRSGKSGKSGKSKGGPKGGKGGRPRFVPAPLDNRNEGYLRMRREARARRLGRDWVALNREAVRELEARTGGIKETWREWNPQRAAQEELDAAVRAGTLTWEEWQQQDLTRRPRPDPIPGTLNRQDATTRGWYPHPSPFRWPAPRTREELRGLPNKPSGLRIDQLSEPWEEGTAGAVAARGPWEGGRGDFRSTIRSPSAGLFGTEREYWQSVHGNREEELRAAAVANAEAWRRRLVVADPVMHTTLPQRPPRPAQPDKLHGVLLDEPAKRSLRKTHVPPPPLNSQLAEPWVDPGAPLGSVRAAAAPRGGAAGTGTGAGTAAAAGGGGGTGGGGAGGSSQRRGSSPGSPRREAGGKSGSAEGRRRQQLGQTQEDAGKDFKHMAGKPKTAVHKPPYNQSWTASLHDKYYGQ